jgi:hypothetical protein
VGVVGFNGAIFGTYDVAGTPVLAPEERNVQKNIKAP